MRFSVGASLCSAITPCLTITVLPLLPATWNGQTLYALHGHLARESLKRWRQGDVFEAGEELATLGDKDVNGGWNPHLLSAQLD